MTAKKSNRFLMLGSVPPGKEASVSSHGVELVYKGLPFQDLVKKHWVVKTATCGASGFDELKAQKIYEIYQQGDFVGIIGEADEVFSIILWALIHQKPLPPTVTLDVNLMETGRELCAIYAGRTGGDQFHNIVKSELFWVVFCVKRYESWYLGEGVSKQRLGFYPSSPHDYFLNDKAIHKAGIDSLWALPPSRLANKIISAGTGARDWEALFQAARGFNSELHVIGDPSQRLSPAPKNVKWHNLRPLPKFLADIRDCKLLVLALPFTRRSTGQLTAATGLFFGRPIIAADIPSMQEYVINEQTGLTYAAGNANDLREKIEYLLKNEALAEKLGKNGKELEVELRKTAIQNIQKFFTDFLEVINAV